MHSINQEFRGGKSRTLKRLPKNEADYYSWEQHAFHALE